VWTKIVGRHLSKDRTRLIQKQWYFTASEVESQKLAAAKKAEWRNLSKSWNARHRPCLELFDEPFPAIPHWYNEHGVEGETSGPSPEERKEWDKAIQPTPSEVAEMYADMDVAECAVLFRAYRKRLEGIDFKTTTNKSFNTDLSGILTCIDNRLIMSELLPADVAAVRVNLLRKCKSRNTAHNYAGAFRMMLDGTTIALTSTEANGRRACRRSSTGSHASSQQSQNICLSKSLASYSRRLLRGAHSTFC
jgi:hypothetical protein